MHPGRILEGLCILGGFWGDYIFWEDSGRIMHSGILKGFWDEFKTILKGFCDDFETSLKGFWDDFKTILKGFWKEFERILKGFGDDLKGF